MRTWSSGCPSRRPRVLGRPGNDSECAPAPERAAWRFVVRELRWSYCRVRGKPNRCAALSKAKAREMAIGEILQFSDASIDKYDAVRRELGWDGEKGKPEGSLADAAESLGNGFFVVQWWRSEHDRDKFLTERLTPAFEKVGGLPQPRVTRFEMPASRVAPDPRQGSWQGTGWVQLGRFFALRRLVPVVRSRTTRRVESVVDQVWSLLPTPAVEVAVFLARLDWLVPAPQFVSMRRSRLR